MGRPTSSLFSVISACASRNQHAAGSSTGSCTGSYTPAHACQLIKWNPLPGNLKRDAAVKVPNAPTSTPWSVQAVFEPVLSLYSACTHVCRFGPPGGARTSASESRSADSARPVQLPSSSCSPAPPNGQDEGQDGAIGQSLRTARLRTARRAPPRAGPEQHNAPVALPNQPARTPAP